MAQTTPAPRIGPLARAPAFHTLLPVFDCPLMTRNLQQPPWFGPYWLGRRIGREGRRWAPRHGRWITYAAASLTMLALVARVVLASCRGLPMAGRRFPPALLLCLLAAVIAPIHMATITAAADPERPLALPAVPRMQNRHFPCIAHPVRL